MNKDIIRREMIKKRKSIPNRCKLSMAIMCKIMELDIFKRAKTIALYKSMDCEVDTKLLIENALINKEVLLPKIVNNEMIFVRINSKTVYFKSKIGVLEPINSDNNVGNIDLIIVPGIAFDQKLNRLGFGKGYYDRYLDDKNIYKIGVAFDSQIVDNLPITHLDIKMDMVITEKRVLKKV